MTSASYILGVFMGPVVNRGGAIVSLSGEDYFVMQVACLHCSESLKDKT